MRAGSREMMCLTVFYIAINTIFYINTALTPDEGNFLFTAEKMLEGHAPYKDYSTDVKPPMNYYFMSLFLAAGIDTLQILRLSALLINAVAACLIFLTASKMFGKNTGIAGAAIFMLTMSMPSMFGYAITGDRLMILFSAASIYFFASGQGRKKLTLSGVLAGMAVLSRQIAAVLIIFYIVYYAFRTEKIHAKESFRRISAIFLCFLLPIIAVAAHFFLIGALGEMLNWTTNEALNIRKDDTWMNDPGKLTSMETAYTFSVLSPLFLLSLTSFFVIITRLYRKKASRNEIFFALLLAASSYPFITVFRYVGLMIIPMSVLSAMALSEIAAFLRKGNGAYPKTLAFLSIIAVFALSLGLNAYSIHKLNTSTSSYYSDMNEVSAYIKNAVPPEEKIYVFGYNPSIYYMSDRDPPPGMYYLYPYKEHVNESEQKKTIAILTGSKVSVAVVDNSQLSKYFNPITYAYLMKEYETIHTIGSFDIIEKR